MTWLRMRSTVLFKRVTTIFFIYSFILVHNLCVIFQKSRVIFFSILVARSFVLPCHHSLGLPWKGVALIDWLISLKIKEGVMDGCTPVIWTVRYGGICNSLFYSECTHIHHQPRGLGRMVRAVPLHSESKYHSPLFNGWLFDLRERIALLQKWENVHTSSLCCVNI